ncbi:MAG: substrate-binding domain-containing protein [bacterium]|nr:substrate-binding domain-containing protein [bacterium]MDE0667453.1 substrate-binding domain-containing protein [bacterium]
MRRAGQVWQWSGAVICAAALFAAACGGADGATGSAPAPGGASGDDKGFGIGGDPAAPGTGQGGSLAQRELEAISGTVTISGSSTVEPISVRVAELFRDVAPGVDVTVDGPGTGDGFKLFCAGETDISNASRPIKSPEAEDCAAAGIGWIELRVGIDGIAVMTNRGNDAVDCLSFEDLYALVGPESVGYTNWSDAARLAAELGSTTSFPDLELDITAPGAESGTYDSFVEIVLEGIGDHRAEEGAISGDEAANTRPDYVSAADDSIIVGGIEGAAGSFGWVGFAYAVNAGVKLLDIDGGDGCVAATPATIASGEYPVSRALYIYVNAERAAASEALTGFVDFYMGETGLVQAVSDVGYVTLTGDARAETVADWSARVIGG